MALYSYTKKHQKPYQKFVNAFSYTLLITGALFLFWSFYPVISFEIYSRLFIKRKFAAPVPQSATARSLKEAGGIKQWKNVFSTNLADYTKAGVWFPTAKQDVKRVLKHKRYKLSIPKLNIKDAAVVVGGEDLKSGLIHYQPVVEPGEFGNVSIFGHSTLPQLWKPNNDYISIFTYLPTLDRGDTVEVLVGGVKYEYEVYDMFVVDPDEISVLDQEYDDSYLTLITCVPPGTYFSRLVVKARLRDLGS